MSPGFRSSHTILLTGGTGFIGSEVVNRLIQEGSRILLLKRARSEKTAWIEDLKRRGWVDTIDGDLRSPNCGLSESKITELTGSITKIVHLGAVYRLSASHAEARGANADGTKRLYTLAKRLGAQEFHHVSSIVAAGKSCTTVKEETITQPSGFRNAYEESKWLSETVISSDDSISIRVYRPGIVIGDSASGITSKFDGPYQLMRFAHKMAPFIIPRRSRKLPIVTVDLVADVIARGALTPPSGTEYINIIDTERITIRDFAKSLQSELTGRVWLLKSPDFVFEWLQQAKWINQFFSFEREVWSYFLADWHVETNNLREFCETYNIESSRMNKSTKSVCLFYSTLNGIT